MTLEELAKAFVELYRDAGLDGISDEMTYAQIDLGNEHYATYQNALALIGEA